MRFPRLPVAIALCGLMAPLCAPAQETSAAPAAAVIPDMNGTLRLILGDSGTGATETARAAAIRQLPSNLEKGEVDALKAFAFGGQPAAFGTPLWHSAVNDMLDVLVRQTRFRSRGAAWLMELADKGRDPVIRDYALQKLPAAWEAAPSEDRQKAMSVLESAAGNRKNSSAGTALLSLERISVREPAAAARLLPLALALAGDDAAAPAARATALQLCAARGERKAAAAARRILTGSTASIALRIAAAGTLGRTGSREDRAILEKAAANEAALSPAVSSATRQLSK